MAVATWNVHRTVGADGTASPRRIEAAIASDIAPRRPQLLALQEADSDDAPHDALLDMRAIARATGLRHVHGPADMRWGAASGGYLGNILFVAPDLAVTRARIIDLPGHCPRAAVMVEVLWDATPLRIVACHLSLSQPLRAVQLRLIGQVVARGSTMQTVLLGDLNEWRPWGGLALSRRMSGMELRGRAVATFPARRPLLPLDRVLSHRGTVRDVAALDGSSLRDASDHRPLFARVTVAGGAAA
ncbi:endonuclease [Mesobaculum littorinae]|uniref:Endonuclease n=1 Tax=Mesobaculum littorinae TaxID=2486419 RepID=A0A438AG47_9RHOB|nr:endonuclease [Mesobaculum littorinae]